MDSTILLTSRAIGVGFLYFPSHSNLTVFLIGRYSFYLRLYQIRNFQELAYYNGGGRASIVGVSLIIIFTFALYPSAYFSTEHNADFDENQSLESGIILASSLVLLYPCYNYKFEQFRIIQLLPTMCFAFSFECSVMPVHSISRLKDYNGKRSYKACFYCLIIAMSYYIILMIQSVLYGDIFIQCSQLHSADFLTIILNGNKNDSISNALSVILLFLVLIQSILQLLYTFYESRTHIHILFEELIYRDTSEYVDKRKRQVKFDEQERRLSSKQMIETAFPDPTSIENSQKENIRRLCFFILYMINLVIACLPSQNLAEYIINFGGSTTIPMLVNVVPGFLYYQLSRQSDEREGKHQLLSLIFGFIGIIQIIVYTTISLYVYIIITNQQFS
ncbi:UNKNOWN [Stylonychia lemnae]|uniref:Uncharacterized protein n=1 Tax=Stylonychia lemnae TaxID=5949 RepID=A0A078AK27_STYLE|nr:UNKNOWN [Stylonychia lemnae]|eukprot:CDW81158.1 UNKNOWN [Stylonychia lemnae]